jgi:hypothetical protein
MFGSTGSKSKIEAVKDVLYYKDNRSDGLSSSADSVKSIESDLDYREKRERSYRIINRLRRKTKTDIYLSEKLSKYYNLPSSIKHSCDFSLFLQFCKCGHYLHYLSLPLLTIYHSRSLESNKK